MWMNNLPINGAILKEKAISYAKQGHRHRGKRGGVGGGAGGGGHVSPPYFFAEDIFFS